jgi:hypothetical protein
MFGHCARWLGYVPFEAITDARNSPPIIRLAEERSTLRPFPSVGVLGYGGLEGYYLATYENAEVDFQPYAHAHFGDPPPQPYRLVFWGEKTSLDTVMDPLAEHYGADLYLPSGDSNPALSSARSAQWEPYAAMAA